ncbi:uncharacterized protein LOC126761415 [Bactrocera neohumeralis]|uniref:uncharacterized protein LOC126761415 n=1 Tax=Bactrocera neohumeralis TaxID=98809 RepID=UPI0021669CF6|nr:uncharacterized protein LOC126761415 [Bactrocera neohumeralis]
MSHLTLRKSFFDSLWPLILSDNVCDTHIKHRCSYYYPDTQFGNIWLHGYLAERGFKNYQPPTVIRCCLDEDKGKLFLCESTEDNVTELERLKKPIGIKADELSNQSQDEKDTLYSYKKLNIPVALEQQIAAFNNSFDTRRKLAHSFINRQYPWYMQWPEYLTPYKLTDVARQDFNSKLKQAIIQDMITFNCKLMIIDLAKQVCLHVLFDWLNFTRFAFVIVLARSEDAVKQIKLMGQNLSAVMVVENMEISWHEQLTESLRVGVTHATALGVFENCAKPFIYVFGRKRHCCKLNVHRVLRKTN